MTRSYDLALFCLVATELASAGVDELSSPAVLDNPAWHALTTAQGAHSEVSEDGDARRFPRKMSPFCAVEQADGPVWDSLLNLVGPGRAVVLIRTEPLGAGTDWDCLFTEDGTQYVCVDPPSLSDVAADGLDTIELGVGDVDEMLELTKLTQPGPFLPRTIEMGRYIGVRREGRLLAMAGERLRGDEFSEISAVCVHPDARRQGLAAALTTILAHDIRSEGKIAMLHVREGNDAAHAVYQAIGFEARCSINFSAWRHQAE